MNKFKLSLLGSMIGLSLNHAAFALDPPTSIISNGTNEFIFIENEADREYFINSDDRNPRFTGANVWTRYGRDNQRSLGYMQIDSGSFGNSRYNVDIWMESPEIQYPFIGIRCQITTGTCPETSYVTSSYVDQNGIYKISPTSTSTRYASFNTGMYEYLKTMSVGTQMTYIVNNCQTREDYDPSKGERCKDMSTGTWRRGQTINTKTGHLKLFDNKAFSEIWVATDGTPSLTNVNDACENIVIGTGTTNQGVACKMVRYSFEGLPSAFNNDTHLYMVIDTAALNGMSIAAADIKINAGGSNTWANWSASSNNNNRMSNQIVTGDGYIQVLFTNSFFQKMLRAGASISGQTGVFTFAVNNTLLPQSGYYQFATNMDIAIIPREYGISIRHKDVNDQVKTGKIGKEEEAITFDYVVTQSAPRKADTVKASMVGESTTKAGKSYCLFKSSDNSLQVPIPAYLSFTQADGRDSGQQYSGCNASATVELKDALWSATPWDEQQSGYFYSTDLKLTFPMNDIVSEFTLDGIDWLGSVRAEGDVKVEATWIGVNR